MSVLQVARAWLIIVPAMIANGAFRELVLKRFVADAAADALSATLGIVIVLVITRYFLRALAGQPTSMLLRGSATLVLLTVAFEFLFGHYVEGESWRDLLENYAIWHGRLWPVVLACVGFTPFLWGRWSIQERRHAR